MQQYKIDAIRRLYTIVNMQFISVTLKLRNLLKQIKVAYLKKKVVKCY